MPDQEKSEHKGQISNSEAKRRDRLELVQRLVGTGARLTAERMIAIQRGEAEPGRARRHP